MAVTKVKKSLSSLFRRAMRNAGKSSDAAACTAVTDASQASAAEDVSLTEFIGSCNSSFVTGQDHGESPLSCRISSILCGNPNGSYQVSGSIEEKSSLKNSLEIPSVSSKIPHGISLRAKQLSREKKQKYAFKSSQSLRFKRLVKGTTQKLGTETMFRIFGRLGQETGVKEYNAMIELYIEHARESSDLEYAVDLIGKAFELFKAMRERGFPIEEGTYGPLLNYLIDMDMIEEFQIFKDVIREASPNSSARLGYYEMLLWIQVKDEEKIEELCSTVNDSGESLSSLQENYLVALCERDRKENLQRLLEIVDMTKVSSSNLLTSIFGYLGRSLLESVAKKFLQELKKSDEGLKSIPELIFSYAASTPDSKVGDTIRKFNKLHEELEVMPSSASYEKLIKYSCDSLEVETALDMVEEMFGAGLIISSGIVRSLLHTIEQINEFSLVRRIYSVMCHENVELNSETFRSMISLCMKIKDFEGAYNMLNNLKKHNLTPNSGMYNSILAGYFREKNVKGAANLIKQMIEADVKPDSMTFSYLINNCDREKDIAKYYEEMKQTGVQATKHIYMSLINAYAACGQFEKAKQVVLDKEVPPKHITEIKSVLISALASNGEIADALSLYEEMKKADCPVEPKAVISLIEHFDSKGEFSTLVRLVNELDDKTSWIDGFFRVILFAIRNNYSSSILDLLKQTKYPLSKDDMSVEYLLEEAFCLIAEMEHSDVKLGLDLLRHMKEELGFSPTRKCLDFLLSACVKAKDKQSALLIWKEYQSEGLPHNVMSFLRMYQVLLAAGDPKGAKAIASKISKEDRDVRRIIKEYRVAYAQKPGKKGLKLEQK